MLCFFCMLQCCLVMIRKMNDDDSTPQERPDSTPQQPPSEQSQTVPGTASQEPSQLQPSPPSQAEQQDERKRLVKECLFRRKLEHGDSVADIQTALAAARDLPSPSESSSASTGPSKPECSICLEGYKRDETICWSKTNECDHIFHSKCIRQWMIQNGHDHCPLCRTNLMSFNFVP
jgi:hypothetical protein